MGISADRRTFYYYSANKFAGKTNSYYAGLPFEINYNWFMGRFGVGGGFKVTGNISKYSFIGLGIDESVGFIKAINNPTSVIAGFPARDTAGKLFLGGRRTFCESPA